MAEGKNTIVVYKNWKSIFDKLSEEEAGKLIKHFFSYVNDENPVLEDRLLDLVFEPIKQTLKLDLSKWDKKLSKKSDNGKAGNLKRWHPDLYEMVLDQKMTIKEAENIAKYRKTSGSDKNIANVADIVIDNDIDIVIDNDISLKENSDKNSEKILIPITARKFSQFNIQDAPPKILQDAFEAWVYSTDIEMRKKITIDHVKDKWLQFYATNKDSHQWYNSENEIYTHFKRWITKQKFIDGNGINNHKYTPITKLSPSAGRAIANRDY